MCGEGRKTKSRNTPTTCVGKTPSWKNENRRTWKHPHVRGEDGMGEPKRQLIEETPPRAWGRRFQLQLREQRSGNTPTYVGKSLRVY